MAIRLFCRQPHLLDGPGGRPLGMGILDINKAHVRAAAAPTLVAVQEIVLAENGALQNGVAAIRERQTQAVGE